MKEPFSRDGNDDCGRFGHSVDINGDLACVVAKHSLFSHWDGNKWVQFDRINNGAGSDSDPECSITGDTVVILGYDSNQGRFLQLYKYDEDLDGVVLFQDTIYADSGVD